MVGQLKNVRRKGTSQTNSYQGFKPSGTGSFWAECYNMLQPSRGSGLVALGSVQIHQK